MRRLAGVSSFYSPSVHLLRLGYTQQGYASTLGIQSHQLVSFTFYWCRFLFFFSFSFLFSFFVSGLTNQVGFIFIQSEECWRLERQRVQGSKVRGEETPVVLVLNILTGLPSQLSLAGL